MLQERLMFQVAELQTDHRCILYPLLTAVLESNLIMAVYKMSVWRAKLSLIRLRSRRFER